MAKRRQQSDQRWDRTDGGLLIPRRPVVPTRRFVQKMGSAHECCGSPCAGCNYPDDLLITISGFQEGLGNCVGQGWGGDCYKHNGTFTVSRFDCSPLDPSDRYQCCWRGDIGNACGNTELYLGLNRSPSGAIALWWEPFGMGLFCKFRGDARGIVANCDALDGFSQTTRFWGNTCEGCVAAPPGSEFSQTITWTVEYP